MHVRLVARVKNDRVLRGAEHPVQPDRQLDDTQVRAEVPARA